MRATIFDEFFAGTAHVVRPSWKILVSLLLLTGCNHDDSSSQAATTFPAGVSTDAPSMSSIHGIYPGSPQDTSCCWVSDDVRFRTTSDPDASSLKLRIWVPTFKPWSADPGYVALTNAQGVALSKVFLKSGFQDVTLPLPKTSVNPKGEVSVRLHFSGARAPKAFGLNDDSRSLSAMIINVTTI